MRSNHTIEEFRAQGMLMGLDYDKHDHTFDNDDGTVRAKFFDADTLEQIYITPTDQDFHDQWQARKQRVKRGEIGAADYNGGYHEK